MALSTLLLGDVVTALQGLSPHCLIEGDGRTTEASNDLPHALSTHREERGAMPADVLGWSGEAMVATATVDPSSTGGTADHYESGHGKINYGLLGLGRVSSRRGAAGTKGCRGRSEQRKQVPLQERADPSDTGAGAAECAQLTGLSAVRRRGCATPPHKPADVATRANQQTWYRPSPDTMCSCYAKVREMTPIRVRNPKIPIGINRLGYTA